MHRLVLASTGQMYWRRRIGFAMLVIFLPVNAPLFLLALEAMDMGVSRPDWFVGLSFLILFSVGGILAFMPRISLWRLFHDGSQP
ncbi:MAG: hypothetical protein ACPF9I_06745 [Candidatus Thalassarchaeaceae archaeon]